MPEDKIKKALRNAKQYEKLKNDPEYKEKNKLRMREYRQKKRLEEQAKIQTTVTEQVKKRGRPRKIVQMATSEPSKKVLTNIQKSAGLELARFMRAKITANDLQPAIFSDLYGNKLKWDNITSQLPDIPTMTPLSKMPPPPPPPSQPTKRGRGRPKKQIMPLTNTEQKMENIIVNKIKKGKK